MSHKVRYYAAIQLPIYDFLLMFHSSVWPNQPTLGDTRRLNLSDSDLLVDPPWAIHVWFPIICVIVTACLAVIATLKKLSYLL